MVGSTKKAVAEIGWFDIIPLERACRILGMDVEFAAKLSPGFCEGKAVGMWDANEREMFVAYKSIAKHNGGK